MNLHLAVVDKNNQVVCEQQGNNLVTLTHLDQYQEGDRIELTCTEPGFYDVRFEDTMPVTLVYINGTKATFTIPFGPDARKAYSPRSFDGEMHLISAAAANPDFVKARRNLALNPYDAHGDNGMYPHAIANVETRNETLFAARNAIDGIYANHEHHTYPFQSWGINRDPDAALEIQFGLPVNLDSIVITLRADFPHDSYWEKATIEFSDGSEEVLDLIKTEVQQVFPLVKSGISWLKFKNLIKTTSDDAPFPALTELEAWGRIAE